MAVRLETQGLLKTKVPYGVKIVWQGNRIARLVFANGVIVEFSDRPFQT